ncbi:unnamed protein product [Caenorhabditis sp. 36 PRJEB53466]|nr:unnamed protein product [Caenorhabditis sp. 36 PRJEB53466]
MAGKMIANVKGINEFTEDSFVVRKEQAAEIELETEAPKDGITLEEENEMLRRLLAEANRKAEHRISRTFFRMELAAKKKLVEENERLRWEAREMTIKMKEMEKKMEKTVKKVDKYKAALKTEYDKNDKEMDRKQLEEQQEQEDPEADLNNAMIVVETESENIERIKPTENEDDEPSDPWESCEACGIDYGEYDERSPTYLDCGHIICAECTDYLAIGEQLQCPFDLRFTKIDVSNCE